MWWWGRTPAQGRSITHGCALPGAVPPRLILSHGQGMGWAQTRALAAQSMPACDKGTQEQLWLCSRSQRHREGALWVQTNEVGMVGGGGHGECNLTEHNRRVPMQPGQESTVHAGVSWKRCSHVQAHASVRNGLYLMWYFTLLWGGEGEQCWSHCWPRAAHPHWAPGAQHDIYLGTNTPSAPPDTLMQDYSSSEAVLEAMHKGRTHEN